MNRTLRNAVVGTVAGGAIIALPAVALGAATGSGASFPATAYSKWCQDSGLCSYTSKGSTGGINDLINGVVDFAASDATLTPQQLSDLAAKRGGATPLYFPTLIGAITVPTNIDGVSKGINIDGPTLAGIFQGTITSWNDSRIRKSNPGVSFPSASITNAATFAPEYCCWPVIRFWSRTANALSSPAWTKLAPRARSSSSTR